MRIGYRRFSGPIGLTKQESGTRGMWLEKRLALLTWLQARQHEVLLMTRPTKESSHLYSPAPVSAPVDVLIVEFGGTNKQFYGKDIEETVRATRLHSGPIVFLLDDPDLWLPWKEFGDAGWSRWYYWVNATFRDWKPDDTLVPAGVNLRDFPFHVLMDFGYASGNYSIPKLAYIGRPGGRTAAVRTLKAREAPVAWYGRQKEWDSLGIIVGETPRQSQRSEFYRMHLGGLVLADSKHKRLGFRTGRAYHALAAGVPVATEADHPDCAGEHWVDVFQLSHLFNTWRGIRERACARDQQVEVALKELPKASIAANEIGL